MSYRTDRTRTGIFTFECPNAITGSYTSAQNIHMRRQGRIPHQVKRFKIHVVNRNQLGDVYGNVPLNNFVITMGSPALDANGEPNGNYTAAPTTVQASTTVPAGSELITGWITPATYTINALAPFMLGYQFTGNTQVAAGGGATWSTIAATNGDVALATPAAAITRNANFGLLHIWIEYEFADDRAPIFVVVGNSRGNAGNGGGIDNGGELMSWPGIVALRERGCALNQSAGGVWAAHYISPFGPGNRWNVWDSCVVYPEVDYVIYSELNSSDITTDQGVSAIANLQKAVLGGKAKWPNARHIITNLGPRQEYTGDGTVSSTMEYARLQVNKKVHLLLGNAETCLDFDSAITNNANPATIPTQMNADGTHGNSYWHAAVANRVPIRRK